MLWAGSMPHMIKTLQHPRFEDYEIDYADPGNMCAFLGNGRTIAEIEGRWEDAVGYIREEDVGFEIE